MSNIYTKRGTKVRTQTAHRYVLLSQLYYPATGRVSKPVILKRSNTRETLEKYSAKLLAGEPANARTRVEHTITEVPR